MERDLCEDCKGPEPVRKTIEIDSAYFLLLGIAYSQCISRNDALMDENAKLRDELAKWERLAAGIDLPEYPVTQFEPKDLERENAKLRELCADMAKMLVLACWTSVESDEEASQCIYRAEALGIEVEE